MFETERDSDREIESQRQKYQESHGRETLQRVEIKFANQRASSFL